MELLSPAGHWEAMVAAVQSGAGAVYMGFGDFNARRGAKNFTPEEFQRAVDYCHLRGVKVYLTLNTLLTDRELPAAEEHLRLASRWGVDGVIVQDWGLLALAREVTPDLPLHASTQMTVHTLSGVEACARAGMRCAVLARELSKDEIAAICKDSPINIEIFAHGALCMCYSGQCAMSALIGQRSGNRGKCAQPCRLPYAMDGGKPGHPLSLKDACLAEHLRECEDTGVGILKLEGRMKRPEYVAVVTGIYARLLRERRAPTEAERDALEAAFSRNGFTEGYWQGKTGPAMFGTRPENAAEPKELFAAARAAYEKEDRRLVDVSFSCTITPDAPASLTASDADGHTVTVAGAVPEAARNRSLTAGEVEDRLQKTGGTAFRCAAAQAEVADGLRLSAADLNALRREALEALTAVRIAPPERREAPASPLPQAENPAAPTALTVSLFHPDQLSPDLFSAPVAWTSLPLQHVAGTDIAPYGDKTRFAVELPRIWRDGDEAEIRRLLSLARDRGFAGVQVHNIGQVAMALESGLTPRGDLGLNVFNTRALQCLKEWGLQSACLSFELRLEQIRDLRKVLPCEAVVYGRLPVMITENCLISNQYGCKSHDLRGPCAAPHALTDRRGERFPVLGVWGCRSEIENAKTLFLGDKPAYRQVGLAFARLRFTTEDAAACAAVLRRYAGEGDFAPPDLTRGLYYRGVD